MKTKQIADLQAQKCISIFRVAALVSGGKDSIFALAKAIRLGHKPACIITIEARNPESYMFHVPAIAMVKLQAKAMNLPLIWKKTKGEKEKELKDLKAALKEAKEKYGVEAVVSGALYSKYQKERIESICSALKLHSITPLWNTSPIRQWREMLKGNYKIIFVGVAASGLTKEWLGREIDNEIFMKLCKLHNVCYVCTGGEGGEFETLVLDCPLFKQRVRVLKNIAHWDTKTGSGWLEIKEAKLVPKK